MLAGYIGGHCVLLYLADFRQVLELVLRQAIHLLRVLAGVLLRPVEITRFLLALRWNYSWFWKRQWSCHPIAKIGLGGQSRRVLVCARQMHGYVQTRAGRVERREMSIHGELFERNELFCLERWHRLLLSLKLFNAVLVFLFQRLGVLGAAGELTVQVLRRQNRELRLTGCPEER